MIESTRDMLLLLPQRYVFSSKSQPVVLPVFKGAGCCCYHKGTYFQANHNPIPLTERPSKLLLLPQRYVFSSKSQPFTIASIRIRGCCCYHKGTYFQANHNTKLYDYSHHAVVVATTKVRIFKQITTP